MAKRPRLVSSSPTLAVLLFAACGAGFVACSNGEKGSDPVGSASGAEASTGTGGSGAGGSGAGSSGTGSSGTGGSGATSTSSGGEGGEGGGSTGGAGGSLVDADKDGSPASEDCDDDDPKVFPGQAAWFDVPAQNGGWDYNCDATEELRWPNGKCGVYPNCGAITPGFTGGLQPPACGVSQYWFNTCFMEPGGPNGPHCSEAAPQMNKTQECH